MASGLPCVQSPAAPKTGSSPTVNRNAALLDLRTCSTRDRHNTALLVKRPIPAGALLQPLAALGADARSETLAERAAWEFAEQIKGALELTTILPGWFSGL